MSDGLDIEAIRTRANAATDGPWDWDEDGRIEGPNCGLVAYVADHGNANTIARCGETFKSADARFIAHAREDVAALISEVEQLRAANETLKQRASRRWIAMELEHGRR